MSDSIRKTVLASVAILALAALGVWWYSGFSLSFMKFFAAEPGIPTATPVTGGSISCTPGTQTVAVGASAQLTAAGGSGEYTWLAPGANTPDAAGSTVTFTYATAGIKKVAVQGARGDGSDAVDVIACTVIVQ
jgi:hypothetical protein